MRKAIMLAAAVAGTFTVLPTFAEAKSCQRAAHDRRVAGTVIGALGGAVIGNAISHRGGGALIGGIGGAVVGNQISRRSCDRGYYYRHHHARYSSRSGYYYRRSSCRTRDVSYYNDRGELVSKQVHTCY